ncbi:spermidine synthase [Phenylobacterium immobile]|uniref:spermidine synthase n=1 Tax=Phenylobacterium immobile TaxID=21 RepID=UPI000AAF9AB8|nr:fused MFS/spermidine synthase [Phenylobacterium immobile]
MTNSTDQTRSGPPPAALFVAATLGGAGLIFLVQPMVAKLALPLLGGGPSIWNTSMAFFQIALLAGYGYAHLLQKVQRLGVQAAIHGAALIAAAFALPLRIPAFVGEPSSDRPILWLLAALTLSVGAPFAALSATAPLVQAWYARTVGREPYSLYAASNLGSLVALLAYPLLIEPTLALQAQRLGWSVLYVAFALLMIALGRRAARAVVLNGVRAVPPPAAPVTWSQRLIWLGLAAAPSSLMLGVTTHLTTDVASAPFLWVVPLALYLITFIVAFQARPAISSNVALIVQAAAVAACAAMLPYATTNLLTQLIIHLAAFFFTALVCHQHLVARRPDASQLTEFYFWMSLGGVVGGGFNAFIAPVIFDNVWEYPIGLVLAGLARPRSRTSMTLRLGAIFAAGLIACVSVQLLYAFVAPLMTAKVVFGGMTQIELFNLGVRACLGGGVVAAFLIRDRTVLFVLMVGAISLASHHAADRVSTSQTWRSFFGVVREGWVHVPDIGGPVKTLSHGTTLHGAQAYATAWRCLPLTYYAPATAIGQTIAALQTEKTTVRIGAVGLGAGTVSAYVRPGDHMTFFEIDPLVVRLASDPTHFSYTRDCAVGTVDYRVGDARLTLQKEPPNTFDVLLIDAFSSDAIPAHLLTVEAMRMYLARIKPDGVIVLHLSNRNLELVTPAQASAKGAGAVALYQEYRRPDRVADVVESSENVLVLGRSRAAMERFLDDPRWTILDQTDTRPWTDDYTNLAGAMIRRLDVPFAGSFMKASQR